MLKNIHLHVDSDEFRQHALEQQAAKEIDQRQRENLNAIQRYMPNIRNYLLADKSSSVSVLCNKHGELNIVDYQSGRVLYGEHPYEEAQEQVRYFAEYPLRVELSPLSNGEEPALRPFLDGLQSTAAETYRKSQPLPDKINVMVVLGFGLGFHVEQLIQSFQINHLIVYEPNIAYIRCSISAMQWKQTLELAKKKNTGLYLQIGKDGSELAAHIEELAANVPISDFYLFQHYPQEVFNEVSEKLATENWEMFKRWDPGSRKTLPNENYLSAWQSPTDHTQWSAEHLNLEQFTANLEALKKYFPAIHQQFKDYQPAHWTPLANTSGEVNVFHKETLMPLYGSSPIEDCLKSFEDFAEQPNKDSLILSYAGKKLNPYLHYQFVEKIQPVLEEIEEYKGELLATIKSMIIFGMGAGYQLPYIFEKYKVEKLFICEPNKDYFYASLFAIDWAKVLQIVDETDARIYLDIGDDGSNLVGDLLSQFHAVGPYILASTYFYQGYYNVALIRAIAELREQLQVIIAMGDYFDHSRYCITHTTWALENKIPFLVRNASDFLSAEMKDTPVFIVGNGPSLDSLLPLIKEHEEQVIVVSCGTALQSLHRHGITPDFHAEIEINRSTFDWAARVGDFSYLKNISLISCNGVHPDACNLYRDTFLAFKEGESASISIARIFPEHKWAMLGKSYPTVTNFAADFITTIGFRQIYLCGVDMGFVNTGHHHSKSSGYYKDDGEQLYDYSEDNDVSILVEGNLRDKVYTKFEFKIAKRMMEQAIEGRCEVYNPNDGAKIAGAQPLYPEDVFVVNNPQIKRNCLRLLKTHCFKYFDKESINHVKNTYQHSALSKELDELNELVAAEVTSTDEAAALIEKQRDLLLDSFRYNKSLIFYYFNGTVNYINSAFMRALSVKNDESRVAIFNQLHNKWRATLAEMTVSLNYDIDSFDFISSFASERRKFFYPRYLEKLGYKYEILPEEKMFLLPFSGPGRIPLPALNADLFRFIFVSKSNINTLNLEQDNQVFIFKCFDLLRESYDMFSTKRVLFLPGNFMDENCPFSNNDLHRVNIAILASTFNFAEFIIIPKIMIDPKLQCVEDFFDLSWISSFYIYDGFEFILLKKTRLITSEKMIGTGDRLSFMTEVTALDLIFREITMEEQRANKEALLKRCPELGKR
ncbi:motility associated factor glycosyltransferase family protein [Alteromonas pelagimontana]|uniref:Motility associated factor glycosyltransferase family protein n=1 Tax=Alteromonas pelagimontana TaxID=1858656 RepID=A0A6M4MF91_9ALTE|nr:6-hydroxymethylpterin diphosphokinase MptE-like protein [Alteromonas pelagimontana]QJR81824.1 motility associated factor glycosyltransferase family protein [Alteromonas pelagimontana]